MEKVILMSIVIATVTVPIWAARDPRPRRGLKRALVGLAGFTLVYAFLLRVVLPRLG